MHGRLRRRAGKRRTTWTVVFDLPRDPITGKRRQRRLSAPTRRQLQAQLADALDNLRAGVHVGGTASTLGQFLAYWLDTYCRSNLRPTTYRNYEQLIRIHVIPGLGTVALRHLHPAQLQSFYVRKLTDGRGDGREGGLSPNTVRCVHTILREALDHGVRWRLLDRNPADATSPPCLKRPQAATWNHDQVRRFLAAAANDGYGPIWLLAAMTGLRRGELLGLQWEDVDLGRGVLRVRRSLVEIGSRLIIQEPKTPSGRRVVRLGRSCVVALEAHRAQALARRSAPDTAPPAGTGYVFTTARGGPIAPRNLIRRFHMLTCRAGVPRIRFHELRHTHATLLLEDGKHSKVVSERLGHASVMITLDTYSHVLPDMQREAADDLDSAIFGTTTDHTS